MFYFDKFGSALRLIRRFSSTRQYWFTAEGRVSRAHDSKVDRSEGEDTPSFRRRPRALVGKNDVIEPCVYAALNQGTRSSSPAGRRKQIFSQPITVDPGQLCAPAFSPPCLESPLHICCAPVQGLSVQVSEVNFNCAERCWCGIFSPENFDGI